MCSNLLFFTVSQGQNVYFHFLVKNLQKIKTKYICKVQNWFEKNIFVSILDSELFR